jgi:Cu/Ag efflux protein CusF
MRTVIGITLAVLLGLGVTAAWADDISGKVKSVDQSERVFVLDDGAKIWVAEGVSMDALKEGASVKASYEERDGKKVATSLEVSE